MLKLTNESCTAPQKQVAVASSSVDQPSLAKPATGKYGLVLSTVVLADMFVTSYMVVKSDAVFGLVNGAID